MSEYILGLLSDPAAWAAFLTLVVMEIVLGIDNLLFISILTNKLPEEHRARARQIGITLALVGLFNIVGSLSAGWLGNRMPKRWILAFIYFARSVVTIGLLASIPFIHVPVTVFGYATTVGVLSAMSFGAFTGLLWLSTVPPTAALVSIMFGPRYMAMLYGFAFFSHQVGGFLGVLLGGILYERTGSYDIVWWLSVALGVASALINLPIIEKAAPLHAEPQPA